MVGVIAIIAGVAAVILSESLKLDTEKVLTGGAYLKGEYRAVLTIIGVAVAIIGLVLTIMAMTNASPSTTRSLFVIAIVASALTVVTGGLLALGVAAKARQQNQQGTTSPQQDTSPPLPAE